MLLQLHGFTAASQTLIDLKWTGEFSLIPLSAILTSRFADAAFTMKSICSEKGERAYSKHIWREMTQKESENTMED